MFYSLHNENRIGFKKLSEAELFGKNSHQTHIGLCKKVLTFFQSGTEKEVFSAILIHENEMDVFYGTYNMIRHNSYVNAPKLNAGREKSAFRRIREYAQGKDDSDWYLMWAGLESCDIALWLIHRSSSEYGQIYSFFEQAKKTATILYLDENCDSFNKAKVFFEEKINSNQRINELLPYLEKKVVSGTKTLLHKNLSLKEKCLNEIGKRGELLIENYLCAKKRNKQIKDFSWVNKDQESYLPYDFELTDLDDRKYYVDVKSTCLSFDEKIYFSDKETMFAAKEKNRYYVWRVYEMNPKTRGKLKKCCSSSPFEGVNVEILKFSEKIRDINFGYENIRLSINPSKCFEVIRDEEDL